MKKILLLLVALTGVAFAADDASEMIKAYSAFASVIGLGIAALGGAVGMGNIGAATISGMARNPGVGGKLSVTMYVTLAIVEAQVIYTLVLAIILLYSNPFIS